MHIDDGDNATNDRRKLYQSFGFELVILQGFVGRSKIHCLGFDLLHARAGANGLVIHLGAGVLGIVGCPFGIQRRGEGGACARDVLGLHG